MTDSFEEDGVKTDAGKRPREDRGRDWRDVTVNQETPRMNSPPSSVEEAEKDSIQSWREHGSDDTLVWALEAPEL